MKHGVGCEVCISECVHMRIHTHIHSLSVLFLEVLMS